MQKARCSPKEFAREATGRLRGFSNPARAAGAEKYFKHTIKTFGATSPQVRALEAELYKTIKKRWKVWDAMSLCDLLFPEPELESKAVASLILSRFKKDFPETLFPRIEGWLASDFLNNWASVVFSAPIPCPPCSRSTKNSLEISGSGVFIPTAG